MTTQITICQYKFDDAEFGFVLCENEYPTSTGRFCHDHYCADCNLPLNAANHDLCTDSIGAQNL